MVRCWARVVWVTTESVHGESPCLYTMKIAVEPFAAITNEAVIVISRWAPRERVSSLVKFRRVISELQMKYPQPGNWCALLIHPHLFDKPPNSWYVHLDGFRATDGSFIPLKV